MTKTTLRPMQARIEAATGQHIGDRTEQQDRVAILTAPRAPGYALVVLADGMGGVSGGALAAEQVIKTAKLAFDLFSPQTDTVEALLASIVHDAHTLIKLTALSSEKQPHSTVVLLALTPEHDAYWTHVGDSRLYRFRGPNCVERTRDHSCVQNLVTSGSITAQEALSHPLSNVLTMALGAQDAEPTVAIARCTNLQPGDAFLLCSDGLWAYFSDPELGAALAVHAPRQASEMLIAKARERAAGGGDNCTLAIIKLSAAVETEKSRRPERAGKAA